MAEALTTLTTPLEVQVSDRQLASLLNEPPAPPLGLLVVREVQEDEGGAALAFQHRGPGRLARSDANYEAYLRLARRSQERQHPVGVRFGEGGAVLELVRADNDVPREMWEAEPGHTLVHFQGHDGVFRLPPDGPGARRLRGLLDKAIRQNARVWFVARKPDLMILDVLPVGWAPAQINLSFVVAPDELLRTADEILRSRMRGTKAIRSDVRAVAKAYIDEADELKRAVRDMEANAAVIQIEGRSPPDIIEKARRLRTVQFPKKELQEKVHAIANSYLLIAERNQQLFDEFKERYRDLLATTGARDSDLSWNSA
jgi:hypothetical protein